MREQLQIFGRENVLGRRSRELVQRPGDDSVSGGLRIGEETGVAGAAELGKLGAFP